MLIEPIPIADLPRIMEPGHFENFVGLRLQFTQDTDAAFDGPASSIADAVNSDVAGDTAGPLNDLIDGASGLEQTSDVGDIVDVMAAANDLEADLIDQSNQTLPDGGPASVPDPGSADTPPIEVPLPTAPGPPEPPEPEPEP